ncbi:MAG: serine protease, partial [Eubacteriales bacterium]|nr:serine protease [Eubacteriales bacterium]
MKKRIVSLALTLLLMLSLSSFAYAANDVSSVRQGVVRIVEVFDVDGADSAISLGSGFFVGKSGQNVRYLMTNFHVVSEYILNGAGAVFEFRDDYGYRHTGQMSLRVYFDGNSYLEASVVDYDQNQDIALLKLEGYTDLRSSLALRIPTDDMVGDSVYIVSYPGNSDDYSNPTSVWGAEDSLVTKGTIGRLVTESGTNAKWIQSSDLIISHGASGGPLVNENGDVLGMVCWGVDSSSSADHMNMCVNIERVVDMLKKNDIEFEMASDRAAQTEPTQAEAAPEKDDSSLTVSIFVFAITLAIFAVVKASKSAKAKKQAEAAA